MDNIIDIFKQKVRLVGTAAGIVSLKAKLRADILFLERDRKHRQHTFGIQLYDYVSVWSARPEFFAANDCDNILIATIRAPLIMAQREIAALHLKRTALKEKINVTSSSRTASFNAKSDHWTETVANTGKATFIATNEAKLKTELALVEREINHYKHIFGITLFQQFSMLEDTKGWLPTDREIRSFYDNCRKDIDAIQAKIAAKEQEIINLDNGGNGSISSSNNSTNSTYDAPFTGASPPPSTTQSSLAMSTGIIDAPAQQQQQSYMGSSSSSSYPQQQQLYNSNTSADVDFLGGAYGGIQQPPLQTPATNDTTQPQQYASEEGLFRYGTTSSTQQNTGRGNDGFDAFL